MNPVPGGWAAGAGADWGGADSNWSDSNQTDLNSNRSDLNGFDLNGPPEAQDKMFDDFLGQMDAQVPPCSRLEGKYFVNFRGMLPDSGSILRGVHFRKVPFAPKLSSRWSGGADGCPVQTLNLPQPSSSSSLLSSLEFSDTRVYEP